MQKWSSSFSVNLRTSQWESYDDIAKWSNQFVQTNLCMDGIKSWCTKSISKEIVSLRSAFEQILAYSLIGWWLYRPMVYNPSKYNPSKYNPSKYNHFILCWMSSVLLVSINRTIYFHHHMKYDARDLMKYSNCSNLRISIWNSMIHIIVIREWTIY